MRVWLDKMGPNLRASDEISESAISKIKDGTTIEAEIVYRKQRSIRWHRRYWLLMTRLAENVEKIDLGNHVLMRIHDAEDMHTAIKFLTGHCDTFTSDVGETRHIVRIPKATNFRELSPDDWALYYRKVLDAVHQHVLQSVDGYILEELASMAS